MSYAYITIGENEYMIRYDFYEGEESTYEHQGVSDKVCIEAIMIADIDIMDIVGYETIQEFERVILQSNE